jgi:histidine ammonia-lyase
MPSVPIVTPHPESIREVVLRGHGLTIPEVVAVARHRARVRLAAEARRRVARCRAVVEALVEGEATVYGLTTGFGSKRDVAIDRQDTETLQRNLVRSHAVGVGAPLPEDVVRAAILLRAGTLAVGHSGVRPVVIERLLELLNRDVYPFVPEKGSVGCSGDLAPLAHLSLVLMGDPEGRIYERGGDGEMSGEGAFGEEGGGRRGDYVARPLHSRFAPCTPERLRAAGVTPLELSSKEGLGLTNGTQVMTAIGVLTAYDGQRLVEAAEAACALSLEAAKGVRFAFDARLHAARPHDGQQASAAHIRALTAGSEILTIALNTARVRGALRSVREMCATLAERAARVALDDEGRALRLELVASHAEGVRGLLERFAVDPIAARAAAEPPGALQGPDEGRLTRAERDAAAFRRALVPAQHELSLLYRELLTLSGVLREEDLGKPRALLGEAIHQLEQAVPAMPKVQDDYSLRCAPQVIGCARHALVHVAEVLAVEMNAATDNPLVFPPEGPAAAAVLVGAADPAADAAADAAWRAFLRDNLALCKAGVLSGGNFHGEPIAMVLDYLAMALAEVGSVSERRIALLVDGARSNGLPSLLVSRSGLNSGLMMPQYTAAALVSENKVLTHPAVTDSIPTGENVEDHNSMGTIAARKCREVLRNAERVVAIELLTAHQGLSFRAPLQPGHAGRALRAALFAAGIAPLDEDRVLAPLIERALGVLRSEKISRIAATFCENPSCSS